MQRAAPRALHAAFLLACRCAELKFNFQRTPGVNFEANWAHGGDKNPLSLFFAPWLYMQRVDLTVGACAVQIINLAARDAPGEFCGAYKPCIFYSDGMHDPLKADVC
jgi:hypothetical protein